jgi:hypothetical protein
MYFLIVIVYTQEKRNHVTMYLKRLMCQNLDTLDIFISFLPIERSGL